MLSKRFIFVILIFAILFLIYKIGSTEFQSLRAEARMQQYEHEIETGLQEIDQFERRLARNNTIAHRILEKKKTGNVKMPGEIVVIFAEPGERDIDKLNLDEIFQVELDIENDGFYTGNSIQQKWNTLLFGY